MELAEPFDISLPAISKHLKVLERAGLISRGREAQWRPCRLETAPLEGVSKTVETFDLTLHVVERRAGLSASLRYDDELFDEAVRLVVAERQASASFLQRRMRVGFSRAARLIDIMEREGILGPQQGSKPREVLVKADYFAEVDERET